MSVPLGLALALLIAAAARGAEVPPELRGRVSAEVTSCEPFRSGAGTRVALVRVRAGASGVREPEIRCGAAARDGGAVLAWARVRGIEQIAAGGVREAMVLVPADAAHDECRCVVADPREDALCAPWQAFEGGRCIEPAEPAAAPPASGGEAADSFRVSRALAPLREPGVPGRDAGADAEQAGLCTTVAPGPLRTLVFALVPEDGTVYVRPLWHRLDAVDRAAFARWARACFAVARIVDAERGVELPTPAQPASAR